MIVENDISNALSARADTIYLKHPWFPSNFTKDHIYEWVNITLNARKFSYKFYNVTLSLIY